MDQIFIQIASYRDAELPLTVRSALASARHPGRLTFGICWQYDEDTMLDLDEFINDPRFRISQFYYEQSHGCCWARNQTNQLYRGEKYTLQIDAHTRFEQDWDVRFIEALERLPSDKPLLTTYPAPFVYRNGREHRHRDHGMQRLVLHRILRNLTTVLKSEVVSDRSRPAKSRFIAAGQIFTYGQFCQEVEYDPDLYFHGEEINLAARAYTHGYDFFCPHEDLLWHYYRHAMPTHSGDHPITQNEQAIGRLHTLLIGDHTQLGKYGLGPQRTLAEFEAYCGINFLACLNRQPEPCRFARTLDLEPAAIEQRGDCDFWAFSLQDNDGNEIYRRDLQGDEIPTAAKPLLQIDEQLADRPVTYILRPHSKTQGFLNQVVRDIH